MNVLLAEDNPVNQEIAAGLLELLDCTVTVVENGRDAVDAAAGEIFDLLLMDCQMPVMNGLDATRAIRTASADGRRLPIVALTAENIDEARAACLDAGMDDLLGKPFTRADLASLLQRWRPAAEPRAPTAPIAAQATEGPALDPAPLEALRALDPAGERGLLQRAIQKFLAYSDEAVSHLAKASRDGDVSNLSRIAHSLKSSSASLGATDLSRQCAAIEKLTADGHLPKDIAPRLEALQAAQQQASHDLRSLIEAG